MFKSKLLKASFIFLFVAVLAFSVSTLQACENDADCDKPCGSKACEYKKDSETKQVSETKKACCLSKQAKQLSTAESSNEEVVLNVKGLTCGGCEGRVQGALTKCEGVKDAQVSHKDGKAVVQIEDGKAKVEELIKAVESVGFSASEG